MVWRIVRAGISLDGREEDETACDYVVRDEDALVVTRGPVAAEISLERPDWNLYSIPPARGIVHCGADCDTNLTLACKVPAIFCRDRKAIDAQADVLTQPLTTSSPPYTLIAFA